MGKAAGKTAKRAKKATPRKKAAKKTTRRAAKRTATTKAAARKKPAAKTRATAKKIVKKPATKTQGPARKAVKKVTVTKKRARQRAAAGSDANQRVHERHDLPGIELELLGYQRDGREFGVGMTADPGRKFRTSGVTSNLSLGGMLARVADELTLGSHCLVRFINVSASVRPEHRWGLILRSRQLETGEYEVAVNFDSPLELLDVEAILAA